MISVLDLIKFPGNCYEEIFKKNENYYIKVMRIYQPVENAQRSRNYSVRIRDKYR